MGRKSKWIEGDSDARVEAIARRALGSRLEQLWHFLQGAADETNGDLEQVHQLRVASRRAAAALRLFRPWLPKRRQEWMDKQVKRVRQAAGDARDCDVLWQRWSQATALESDERAALLTEIRQRRSQAQVPICEVHAKLAKRDFSQRLRQLVRRIDDERAREAEQDDESSGPTAVDSFGAFARASLRELIVPYLAAGEAEMDIDRLHAFRIQGKQVRYAMEIFAGAFDDDFRQQLYPVVVVLQNYLGRINDHVSAQRLFDTWRAESDSVATRKSLELASAEEHAQLEPSRQEFLSWWSCERRAELRLRFARYVDLPAEKPVVND